MGLAARSSRGDFTMKNIPRLIKMIDPKMDMNIDYNFSIYPNAFPGIITFCVTSPKNPSIAAHTESSFLISPDGHCLHLNAQVEGRTFK